MNRLSCSDIPSLAWKYHDLVDSSEAKDIANELDTASESAAAEQAMSRAVEYEVAKQQAGRDVVVATEQCAADIAAGPRMPAWAYGPVHFVVKQGIEFLTGVRASGGRDQPGD